VRRLARHGDVSGLVRAAAFRDDVNERDGRGIDLGAATRRAAIVALGEREEEPARAAVRAATHDSDAEVRAIAIAAVRASGDGEAVPALVPAWREAAERPEVADVLVDLADPSLADAYAGALVNEGDDEDTILLAELLGRTTPEFATALVGALAARLGEEGGPGARAGALVAAAGEPAVEPAIAALSEPAARVRASEALGALRDTRGVAPLVRLVDDPQPAVRRAAVRSLGELRDARAVQALLSAARDDDFAVRSAAVDALNELGAVAVIYSLGALLRPLLRVVAPGFDRDWLPRGDEEPRRVAPTQSLRRLLRREG
jgi:HEAT repeat protein